MSRFMHVEDFKKREYMIDLDLIQQVTFYPKDTIRMDDHDQRNGVDYNEDQMNSSVFTRFDMEDIEDIYFHDKDARRVFDEFKNLVKEKKEK